MGWWPNIPMYIAFPLGEYSGLNVDGTIQKRLLIYTSRGLRHQYHSSLHFAKFNEDGIAFPASHYTLLLPRLPSTKPLSAEPPNFHITPTSRSQFNAPELNPEVSSQGTQKANSEIGSDPVAASLRGCASDPEAGKGRRSASAGKKGSARVENG